MADERELVRSRIDIVDLVGQRVRLKRSGKNWTGLCPFHEDRHPSFSVSPDIGRYKCWSCDASGDVFTWVMETQGVEFREALEILAKQAGVELTRGSRQDHTRRRRMTDAMAVALDFFREQLQVSQTAREYCKRRGLDDDTLARWDIGYAPDVGEALAAELKRNGCKLSECRELFLVDGDEQLGYGDRFRGRIIFPIRDDQGNLVAFGGRLIGDGRPKYINSSDTPLFSKSRTLYGMHIARDTVRKLRRAVVVEGYLDVIACHRAGVNNAVATLGTSLAEQHVKRLSLWCDEVVLLYDSDKAGRKAAQRATELLTVAGMKVSVALLPEGGDPDTLLAEQGPEAVRDAVEKGIEPFDFLLQQIERRLGPDQQEYWDEVARALATLPSHLEVERRLMPLAHTYPFMRDPDRAARALRGMVRKAAKSRRSDPDRRYREQEAALPKEILLPPLMEADAFQALADLETRQVAWEICRDSTLFVSGPAVRLSAAVGRAWPEVPPEGEPADFLDEVEGAEDRAALSALFMNIRSDRDKRPIGGLEDTYEAPRTVEKLKTLRRRLVMRREEIALQAAVGKDDMSDAELMRLDSRLKELKGAKAQEGGTAASADPFATM
ncbi:MAG: DNA primase [Armatimonadetes bacterium]|nr:DNA primase [Armatimonadota bacterium]